MWRFTRDHRRRGMNERILARDAERLRDWRRGRPVFGGRWQLCYVVENFAPCLQQVGLEQQGPDGTWRQLQSCLTVEFQTRAAQPRATLAREHAGCPDWDGDPANFPRLRFTLRGAGQVRIRDVELVDGRQRWRPRGWAQRSVRTLGPKAPTRGLPPLDWSKNLAVLELRFG
jgi:hypothetical protein